MVMERLASYIASMTKCSREDCIMWRECFREYSIQWGSITNSTLEVFKGDYTLTYEYLFWVLVFQLVHLLLELPEH